MAQLLAMQLGRIRRVDRPDAASRGCKRGCGAHSDDTCTECLGEFADAREGALRRIGVVVAEHDGLHRNLFVETTLVPRGHSDSCRNPYQAADSADRYQGFVEIVATGRAMRTRASTATHAPGNPSTGLRSSSATAGCSRPRRDKR